MAQLRNGLTGAFAAALLFMGAASSVEAAVFLTVPDDAIIDTSNDVEPSANELETSNISSDPSNPAQQLIAENVAPAPPSRAGWLPLIGALILVAFRMRRPKGRKRISSAV